MAEAAAQFAGGLRLGEEFARLGRGAFDGVGACEEAQWRPLLVGEGQQGVDELREIAGLLPVDARRRRPTDSAD
ncbi:hypothetical protein [Streptomyces iakyrus]|uniref:hypothetical protein n=1 Tax=Streptomyces iakyrus TaxID=68219 RepID=UPI003D919DC4